MAIDTPSQAASKKGLDAPGRRRPREAQKHQSCSEHVDTPSAARGEVKTPDTSRSLRGVWTSSGQALGAHVW